MNNPLNIFYNYKFYLPLLHGGGVLGGSVGQSMHAPHDNAHTSSMEGYKSV